ncbi:grpE protein homolog, mitochondrial isoform X1 [Frankliniella occidentalis]|uniref:GrpE protein homolog n=1 Tax=Frankliniella occidentalis TaxID=133901 RepID=A0A6J1RZ68_FRAOC|nr:grpE protein homolog, mitochondrial isoform X1 [Frankliniella occidentalis]
MACSTLTSGYRLTRLVLDRSSTVSRNIFSLIPSSLRSYSASPEESKDTSSIPPPGETETEKKLKAELEKVSAESKSLLEKVSELDDKYKRLLADRENLRNRLTKQIEDAKIFGIQSFCKDLLEVADILGKATESVPKEEVKDNNPHLKNLYEGLTMTEAQLLKVFTRHGLLQVNPLNEKFDPNLHEALFEQEVQGKEPGSVVVVSKVGYKLQERCIRPALVGVAKGS